MKHFLVFSAVAALVLAGAGASAQQRIAYVNSSKIFQDYPAAQEAQRRIDSITKPLQDSLADMQKQLQAMYDDYQKKEALMNDAAKKARQQEIIDAERRYNDFRLEKFGNDGSVAQQTEKIVAPIREKIKAAIASVAKEERYNFVFDKSDQVQLLLYADAKDDLTYKVLDRLKRGKS